MYKVKIYIHNININILHFMYIADILFITNNKFAYDLCLEMCARRYFQCFKNNQEFL